jgi:hypothetical protein
MFGHVMVDSGSIGHFMIYRYFLAMFGMPKIVENMHS